MTRHQRHLRPDRTTEVPPNRGRRPAAPRPPRRALERTPRPTDGRTRSSTCGSGPAITRRNARIPRGPEGSAQRRSEDRSRTRSPPAVRMPPRRSRSRLGRTRASSTTTPCRRRNHLPPQPGRLRFHACPQNRATTGHPPRLANLASRSASIPIRSATSESSTAPHSTPRSTKPASATAVAGSSRKPDSPPWT